MEHGQATPSIVVVVSVVLIAVAMVAFFAGGDQEAQTTPQAQSSHAAATPSPPTVLPKAPGPDRKSTADKDRRGDRHRASKHRARPKRPRGRQVAAPAQGPPDVYVEVYNNSSITGLAGDTAARLQDGGWQVVGVDNWHGSIPASTVYYPDGMTAEANQLADALGIGRVHEAVSPMRFDRLTVILTPDAA